MLRLGSWVLKHDRLGAALACHGGSGAVLVALFAVDDRPAEEALGQVEVAAVARGAARRHGLVGAVDGDRTAAQDRIPQWVAVQV